MIKDCRINKDCIYCKMRSSHHRSLCPKQFPKRVEQNLLKVIEDLDMVTEEHLVMQTASVKLTNLEQSSIQRNTRLLLDCGSQRTYITKYMAKQAD